MAIVILGTIVTFGIWALVWSYQNGSELKAYRNEGIDGVIYLILTFLFWPITMFLMADEVDKLYREANEPSPINALWGLWFLLPIIGNLIWYIRIQDSLNTFWIARGSERPAVL